MYPIKTSFSESHRLFLFLSNSSETGEAELQLDMPDSITTWVTEAVGLSEKKGLGVAERVELRTFKPFFVDFTLPYSLIRGEQTKVPLTVYNYMSTCAEVRGPQRGDNASAAFTHKPSNEHEASITPI